MKNLAETSANLAVELAGKVIRETIKPDEAQELVREALPSSARRAPAAINCSRSAAHGRIHPHRSVHDTVFDVSAERLARVYAKAALDAAGGATEQDALMSELESLETTCSIASRGWRSCSTRG